MDDVTDEELMTRVRDGAAENLGVLFDRYHLPLFRFFARLTNDRALSEDLVQESFYRILKYRRTYKPEHPFRTWMYQVARSVRADAFHARRETVDLSEAPLAVVLPIDPVHDEQQITRLRQALMDLPEEKRELLILARFQEMKYDEIASLLQTQPKTIKVRMHRAMRALKESYDRLGKDDVRHGMQ